MNARALKRTPFWRHNVIGQTADQSILEVKTNSTGNFAIEGLPGMFDFQLLRLIEVFIL